ncbi:unnamed protein product [Penicillium nalgiovense]|uniref:NADH:flavin oxidoreductase/NADH oxidase N-terminal domain-containing protein n=1 Tax=Penicillium nalgiovense TaxID=60175 RepID=A0A9W4I1P9_PENNA|nr:unnamed protein product [Penicillium nalgiovense]CAG8002464.1 unnamed protein product [Penicillium nalgiovense]CAG8090549.1 unnamed protein product [Penicillium nalgiovense]CAG8092788.1 unnamed protein product [Penicillium nalgiovense]CAG8108374.1 unnamed protein product [Penicillium nalgiovense]
MPQSRLFVPLKIGDMEVEHRIRMAPLTRFRATEHRVSTLLMKGYYSQRAAVPGTLIITEGTFISATCGRSPHAPGIWHEDQVAAWRIVTDEIYPSDVPYSVNYPPWNVPRYVARKEWFDIVAPSAIPMEEGAVAPGPWLPTRSTDNPGFYVSNKRDDEYGGNVDNRSRLLDDVIKAVVHAIGPERIELRLSPWSTFQGMRMQNPIPQFTDVIRKARQAEIAYLHLVESRISGSRDYDGHDTLDFAYDLWNGPFLTAGGYTSHEARKLVDEKYLDMDIMVIVGWHFISNPDLISRIKKGLELNAYKRDRFYVVESAAGYSDYPFSKEYLASGTYV